MEYDTLMGCLELLRGTGGVHEPPDSTMEPQSGGRQGTLMACLVCAIEAGCAISAGKF